MSEPAGVIVYIQKKECIMGNTDHQGRIGDGEAIIGQTIGQKTG